jgi:hypothetical protein
MGIKAKNAKEFQINPLVLQRFNVILLLYVMLIASAFVIPEITHAADGTELTDLFETTAFTGSWEVFSKFNWLGKLLNFLISAFCLIGLVLTAFRLILTMLYKSNEAIFDRVYDLKQHGRGQKFFGFGAMGREVFQGNYGVGLDAIVGFLLSLLPDIKAYSDYNPEKMMYNLQEDDTLTTYVLKVSIPTIMSIFFFAIGFNGTLLQGFGNVANAMARGAKRLVEVDLAEGVDKVMSAGSYYQFSYDTSDEFYKLKKNICTSIYNKVLLKMDDISTGSMQTVGAAIQACVDSETNGITASDLDSLIKSDSEHSVKENHAYAKNYSYTVYLNSNSEKSVAGTSDTVNSIERIYSFSDLGLSGNVSSSSTPTQIHVIITKKADADETDYYSIKSSNSTSTTKETSTPSLQSNGSE